ncbi:MAG: hypothetical protein AB7O21_13605 [Gammaproteobacteria bacterium]
MRSDARRLRPVRRGLAAVALCALALATRAEPPAAPSPAPAPAEDPERPEYRARALPTDTFKPSEQVSEDFAVPFPADI